jgi:hypothetical protein
MVWGAVAVAVGSAIYGAVSSSQANKRNARLSSEWAQYNAAVAQGVGRANAQAANDFAAINASMVMMGAQAEAAIAAKTAEYNAGIRLQVAEYNARMIEKEIPLIWDQANLDIFNLGQEMDQLVGANRAMYGASGVRLDEGTPLDVEVSNRTQEAMEVAIIRHNADVAAARLVDQAAMSRWEGTVEAGQIMYEGRMSGALSLARGTLQAGGMLAQGSYDSAMLKYNAAVNSRRMTIGGRVKAADYRAAGDRALVDGLFNATSKGVQAYAATYRPTPSTATTGAGTSPIV